MPKIAWAKQLYNAYSSVKQGDIIYDKNGAVIGEATDTRARPNGTPSSYGSVYLTNYKWFSGYVEKLENGWSFTEMEN